MLQPEPADAEQVPNKVFLGTILHTFEAAEHKTSAGNILDSYRNVPPFIKDYCVDPNYENFHLPYHILAYHRYNNTQKILEAQFQKEFRDLIEQQDNGMEAARLTQFLSYMTLWPPYHSIKEINKTADMFNAELTPEQRRRLLYLMHNNIV